jgi:hypothetical protein
MHDVAVHQGPSRLDMTWGERILSRRGTKRANVSRQKTVGGFVERFIDVKIVDFVKHKS